MKNNNIQGCTSKEVASIHTPKRPKNFSSMDNEFDFEKLWRAIWSGKLIIIIVTAIFILISVLYALNQPNIYKASTLLAPANEQGGAGGLAKMAGQLGGLASLAGINLGGGGTDKTGLALEVLKSRVFLEDFIEKHNLLVPLLAVKNWDQIEDRLIYNEKVYDISNNKWLREVKAPNTAKPSRWESYEALTKILTISTDKKTGMITVAIEHYSPSVAIQWVLWLVEDLNKAMREQDRKEAQNSIDFLTKKLDETQLSEMRNVFFQLIEEQTKTIMLAEVSEEYIFKTIDPANAPDDKIKPKRALIVVLGAMFGGLFSTLIVLILYFKNNRRLNN